MVKEYVRAFLQYPFPLWETTGTKLLAVNKWKSLKTLNLDRENYLTSKFVLNSWDDRRTKKVHLYTFENENINLEISAENSEMDDFYQEHGLNPLKWEEFESENVITKMQSALELIGQVNQARETIVNLVRSVQILRQEDPQTDTSYTHPKIPFSIFLSVCCDDFLISRLRVAESILHESMHLKLSLIENVILLLRPDTGNLYFSPWRDEKRPPGGVLHGLFVFRAIHDFYEAISFLCSGNAVVKTYIGQRMDDIKSEIDSLKYLKFVPDLTKEGEILVKNLLQF